MDARSVRMLLNKTLRSDSDFDSFCHDYFSDVYCRFSNTMDRIQKTTILLQQIQDYGFITEKLQEYCDQTTNLKFDNKSQHDSMASQRGSMRCRRRWWRRDMKRAALVGSVFGAAMKSAEALWEAIAKFLSAIWSWSLKLWGGSQVAAGITLTTLTTVTLGGITVATMDVHQDRINSPLIPQRISHGWQAGSVAQVSQASFQDLALPRDSAAHENTADLATSQALTSPKVLALPNRDLALPASPTDLAEPTDLVTPRNPDSLKDLAPFREVEVYFDMKSSSIVSQPDNPGRIPAEKRDLEIHSRHPCINKDDISTSLTWLSYSPARDELKEELLGVISSNIYSPEAYGAQPTKEIDAARCKLHLDHINVDIDLTTSIPKDHLGREIYVDRYNLTCDVAITLKRKSQADAVGHGSQVQLHMKSDSNPVAKQKFLKVCRVAGRAAISDLLEILER